MRSGCQKSSIIIGRRFLWKAPKHKPHRSKSVLVRGMILDFIHITKKFIKPDVFRYLNRAIFSQQ